MYSSKNYDKLVGKWIEKGSTTHSSGKYFGKFFPFRLRKCQGLHMLNGRQARSRTCLFPTSLHYICLPTTQWSGKAWSLRVFTRSPVSSPTVLTSTSGRTSSSSFNRREETEALSGSTTGPKPLGKRWGWAGSQLGSAGWAAAFTSA